MENIKFTNKLIFVVGLQNSNIEYYNLILQLDSQLIDLLNSYLASLNKPIIFINVDHENKNSNYVKENVIARLKNGNCIMKKLKEGETAIDNDLIEILRDYITKDFTEEVNDTIVEIDDKEINIFNFNQDFTYVDNLLEEISKINTPRRNNLNINIF